MSRTKRNWLAWAAALGVAWAGASAGAGEEGYTTGRSGAFRVDAQQGARLARAMESIEISGRWNRAGAMVTVDGDVVATVGAGEEKTVEWTPEGAGWHVLRHESGGEVLEAAFWVSGSGMEAGGEGYSTGRSEAFRVDARQGARVAGGVESIEISGRWNGAKATVTVNGAKLASAAAGKEKTVTWTPEGPGLYQFRHESGGQVLEAAFWVPGSGPAPEGNGYAAGRSGAFRIDARSDPRLTGEGDEHDIAVSGRWEGAAATATADGKPLAAAEEGEEKTAAWVASGAGLHVLRHESGGAALEASFLVIGDGAALHTGRVEENETWAAGSVHVVDGTLTVAAGATLSIGEGSVVKFTDGSALVVEAGGACTAEGVIFTHIADDTAGGDTLGDGDATKPVADRYSVTGDVKIDAATEMRWLTVKTSGTLSGTNTWPGYRTYSVTGNVTVAKGATLTIMPGAIVKFGARVNLTVQSGGTLTAEGTRAAPIVFTSIKDDEHGGDTNGDGDKTSPKAGDWDEMRNAGGTMTLAYAKVLYGGYGEFSNQGDASVRTTSGKTTLDGCEVAHSDLRLLGRSGGTVTARNCVLRDGRWGWDGAVTFVNGVVADCTTGAKGGTAKNTVFWQCGTYATETKPSHSVVYGGAWSGAGGTTYADPLFLDAANGDFRIAAGSPCIDAGDGRAAPATDWWGQPRMDEPDVEDKGTAAGNGAVPDIGLHEYMPRTVASDVDLAAVSVEGGAGEASAGGTLAVSWTVENKGTAAAGAWRDVVELVGENGAVAVLGERTTEGLAAGGTKTLSQTFAVPSMAPGAARLRVRVNPHRDVFEGTLTGNNTAVSAGTVDITLPIWTAGAAGELTLAAGGSAAFRIPAGSGTTALVIRGGGGAVAAWAAAESVPAALRYDAAAVELSDGSLLLSLPKDAAERDYNVALANGGTESATVRTEALTAAVAALEASPGRMSNSGTGHLTLAGAGMDRVSGARLEGPATLVVRGTGAVLPALWTGTVVPEGAAPGTYEIVLEIDDGTTVRTGLSLRLYKPTAGAKLKTRLEVTPKVRQGRVYSGKILYENTGDEAMEAPYLALAASGATIRLAGEEDWQTAPLRLMGVSPSDHAGVLDPGEKGEIFFEFRPQSTPRFTLSVEADSGAEWRKTRAELSAAATRVNLRGRRVCRWGELVRYAAVFAGGTNAQAASGLLLDARSGEALAGARVHLIGEDGAVAASDTVDEDGRFVLEGLQGPATFAVRVSEGAQAERFTVEIPESGDVGNLAWTGTETATIRLSFEGLEEGDWEKGIRVEAIETASGETAAANLSGTMERGVDVPGRGIYAVAAVLDDGTEAWTTAEVAPGLRTADATLDFGAGGSASGSVLDADGNPVEGAVVTLEAGNGAARYATSGSDGTWRARNLAAGEYEATAVATGCGLGETAALTVADGEETVGTDLRVQRFGNVLTLQLPETAAGCTAVFAMRNGERSGEATVGADGRVRFEGLPDGVGDAKFFGADGTLADIWAEILVKPGENVLAREAFAEKATFVGKAVDRAGKPVAAKWRLATAHGDGVQVASDGTGTAAAALREGDYYGTVSAPGHAQAAFLVRLDANKKLTLVLDNAGRVGHVLPSGVGRSNAAAVFKGPGGVKGGRGGVDGTFVSEPFADGSEVDGFVVHAKGAYRLRKTAVKAGTTNWAARIESGRAVAFRFDPPGKVTTLELELGDGSGFTATMAVPGSGFRMEEFPAGPFTVRAYSATGELLAKRDVGAAETEVALVVDTGVTITGRVTGATAGQCTGGSIAFCLTNGNTLCRSPLAANGAFRAKGVPSRFEKVWVELSDGTMFDVSRADAEAAGWLLSVPRNMGIVHFVVTTTDEKTLPGYTVTVVSEDGHRTEMRTDTRGQVHVQQEEGREVRIDDHVSRDGGGGDHVQQTKKPSVCPTCGHHPCQCTDVDGACPVCGQNPCKCNVQTVQTDSDEDPTEEEAVEDEELPPLSVDPGEIVHWSDWCLDEGRWFEPLEEYLARLRAELDEIGMDKPPTCPDSGCTYCVERNGPYNKNVYLRYLKLRGRAVEWGYDCEMELNQIQFISRLRHRQMVIGVGSLGAGAVGDVAVAGAVACGAVAEGSVGATVVGALASGTMSGILTAADVYADYAAGTPQTAGDVASGIALDAVANGIEEVGSQILERGIEMQRIALMTRGRLDEAARHLENVGQGVRAGGRAFGAGVWAAGFIPKTLDFYRELNDYIAVLDIHLAQLQMYVSAVRAAAETPYKTCPPGNCAANGSATQWAGCHCKGDDPLQTSVTNRAGGSEIQMFVSRDPNEMAGPAGAGEARYVAPGTWVTYTVYFENEATAETAAQEVRVEETLDPALDWSTFEVGEVAFGEQIDNGLSGRKRGASEARLAGTDYHVKTESEFDAETGKAGWYLRIVDKATADQWPKDLHAGILPPNDGTGRGEGHITYRVKVREDAATGTVVRASASIVFDYNAAIETDPAWWNTVAEMGEATVDLGNGVETNVAVMVGAPWGGQLPDPGKVEGLRFAGWFTGPDGTGREVTAESVVEAGAKLYAFWDTSAWPELWLDVTWGAVEIGTNGVVQGHGPDGEEVEGVAERYVLTGKSKANGVKFEGGSFTNTWTNLVVDLDGKDAVAVAMETACVEVELAGDNFAGSGEGCAGVSVSRDSTLVLCGTGRLEARGGEGAAGIGGGGSRECGRVEICGGTIEAHGGEHGAGIGGGPGTPGADVAIVGGSVKARGNGEGDIGGGEPTDGEGTAVYEVEVPFAVDTLPVTVAVDLGGGRTYQYEGMGHRNDTSLWFWLPDGTYEFEVDGDYYGAHVKGASVAAVFTDPGAEHFEAPAAETLEATGEGWRVGLNPAYRTTPFELWTATGLNGRDWNWEKVEKETYRVDAETGMVEWKGKTEGLRVFKFEFLPKE